MLKAPGWDLKSHEREFKLSPASAKAYLGLYCPFQKYVPKRPKRN